MQSINSALSQILTLLQNGQVSSRPGIGTPDANTADFTLTTVSPTATLYASTVKGLVAIHCSDGTYGVFDLPHGSNAPALVLGSSGGEVAASPGANQWGVAYSGGNWQISNQTSGTLSFWKLGLLGG